MHFSKELYISESLKNKKRQIKWKLKTHSFMPSIYIISLADNNDLLEIYHSGLFKQKYFRKHSNMIVGIANSQEEAVEIVQTILKDVMKKNNNLDVKSYFTGGNNDCP